MPTFENKESGLSVRNKLNEAIIAIDSIDDANLDTVANNITSVNTTASNITDVNTVSTDIANVNTTATNISDVQVVAADLNEPTSEIEVVAGNILDVSTVSSNIGNVNTVAGISTDVTAVAGDEADIGTVSTNISSVDVIASDLGGAGFDYDLGSVTQATEGVVGTPDGYIITVFNIRNDITTVSGIQADVSSVAAIDTDVTTVSSISSDVTTTANNIAGIQTVASDLNEITSDIDVVSTNIANVNSVGSNITDVNTVAGIGTEVQTVASIQTDVSAVSSVSSDVTTVSGISANVTDVAGISADVTNVSGISADVSTVSGISSDVSTVANNVADLTNFADVYIGPASSDPSTRSDGTALQSGDLYFNTTDNRLKVYDGTQWEITARDDSDIRSLFSASGDLSYDSATGGFFVTTYKSSDFDTDFASKTTSDLTEGTNLYYTDARVNADIDARVDKTFVDALNVDADTLDGQDGAYYLDRANHTGTQTLSTISDSGALAALNTVDTAQIANQAVTDDKLATSLDLGSI